MVIDWSKLALYGVVIAGLISLAVMRHDYKRVPTPPLPPVTVTVIKPAAEPVKPPVVVPETPVMGPKVAAPLPAKPVAKPVPKPVAHPLKKGAKHRPHPKRLDCSKVPQQAYEHSEDVVVAYAQQRGVSGSDLARLRRCIRAHAK